MNNSEISEIGDSYNWGRGIATTIAGFFFASEIRKDVALTVAPPHQSSNCNLIRNSLLCCAMPPSEKYSNTIQGQKSPYRRISSTPPRFGDRCTIYKKTRKMSAEIVGTHRSVRIRGQAFHELFEFETEDDLVGYAGAPVVASDELVGIVVAVTRSEGRLHQGFFASTSLLTDQLTLLPHCHASDTAAVGGFLNMLTTFREQEEMA